MPAPPWGPGEPRPRPALLTSRGRQGPGLIDGSESLRDGSRAPSATERVAGAGVSPPCAQPPPAQTLGEGSGRPNGGGPCPSPPVLPGAAAGRGARLSSPSSSVIAGVPPGRAKLARPCVVSGTVLPSRAAGGFSTRPSCPPPDPLPEVREGQGSAAAPPAGASGFGGSVAPLKPPSGLRLEAGAGSS